ncbi:hypothetical protein GJW-30_1_01861 [Variibacter gotjawalensis]|uniref:L,D-TPase catalytic domain-containing protein n=1 Tax=Variibacter gotjawalensis TaxID=1333996 RepID=A0A0S3PTW3_9BRAD|nr:L,D-transpeptidase [Variibacter gotjawalensis]NIK49647.1 hypothetical protein [Variibacter gotjawalensis]RZS45659.1 L,D-transpeptidase-like protein [Variibacter gotjawalensis]BAT59330.1 hypothetical protein GJW-30_1_01861 [Variibacter gotjawalensis]
MRLLSAGVIAASLFATAAHADLAIVVDKATQRMTVTIDGQQKYVWPVSTGKVGHFTPVGQFKPFRMEIDHKSDEFDDAPMPHSVFFTRQGHAIHGSYNTKQLGQVASSGCVRLAPQNAALLFSLVKQHGLTKTQISIDGDERQAIAAAARRGGPQVAAAAPAPQAPAANQGVSVWPNPFAPFTAPRTEPAPVAAVQPRPDRRGQAQAQARPQQPRQAYYYDERNPRGYYAQQPVYQAQPVQAPARAYPRYYQW